MINFNGELHAPENLKLSSENRAFKYGDAIFETIKVMHKKVIFWEDHYFRLMASMRMLRMKIPINIYLRILGTRNFKNSISSDTAIPSEFV